MLSVPGLQPTLLEMVCQRFLPLLASLSKICFAASSPATVKAHKVDDIKLRCWSPQRSEKTRGKFTQVYHCDRTRLQRRGDGKGQRCSDDNCSTNDDANRSIHAARLDSILSNRCQEQANVHARANDRPVKASWAALGPRKAPGMQRRCGKRLERLRSGQSPWFIGCSWLHGARI